MYTGGQRERGEGQREKEIEKEWGVNFITANKVNMQKKTTITNYKLQGLFFPSNKITTKRKRGGTATVQINFNLQLQLTI